MPLTLFLLHCYIVVWWYGGTGIVHRDLKPENVMVRANGSIFLIDFGTAKNLKNTEHNGPEFVGTPEYMSPEAIESQQVGPEGDLWALGCMAYQMLSGQNAFQGGSQYMTFLRQKKGEYSSCPWWSNEAKDFIDSLLNVNPMKRLGSNGQYQDLKNHPFLKHAFDRMVPITAAMEATEATAATTMDATTEAFNQMTVNGNYTTEEMELIGSTFSTLPEQTKDEIEMARLVQAVVASDIATLKEAALYDLPYARQQLLQHKLSERHIMSNPEVIRLFFKTRDGAMFQRASMGDPLATNEETKQEQEQHQERSFLGMSIYEENKFTKAFAFVHINVDRYHRKDQDDNNGMLRRAIAAINRIHPRPRFVALSGATLTTATTTTTATPSLSSEEQDICFQQYKQALRFLAPNIAVVTVPGATDFPDSGLTMPALQAFRTQYGADYYSFWIGRIMYIVLNSVLLNIDPTTSTNAVLVKERQKQLAWFEREVYVGRTRGTQVHLLTSNPLFLKKPKETRTGTATMNSTVLLNITTSLPLIETLKLSWGKYIFSSHATRNGKGIFRGSDTSYEECDVRSYTTSNIHGLPPKEEQTEQTEQNSSFVGGVRVVRVFEAFAKPEYFKINEMPTRLDLDLTTNSADGDQGSVVPSTAQADNAPTWMSTPTGGETKRGTAGASTHVGGDRPEPVPSAPSTVTFKYVDGKKIPLPVEEEEKVEEGGEEDDELVIEDITGKQ